MPFVPLLLAATVARCPAAIDDAPHAAVMAPIVAIADTTGAPRTALDSLYAAGRAFRPFLGDVRARRDEWRRSTDSARIDTALVARGRRVPGRWRLLVVAVDACGDSMRAIPVLAALDDSLPNLELRIVAPSAARAAQDANRTWDGRIATPTILLLDAQGRQAGCIVERPRPLRHAQRAARGDLTTGRVTTDSLGKAMLAWWRADRGTSIAAEAVELLESAGEGIPLCERGQTPPT